MKLSEVLKTMHRNSLVWVFADEDNEFTDNVYRIEWHHEDLLEREVKSLSADGGTINIVLK